MVRAFAFDLDGTLTQHRTKIDDKNLGILEKLSEKYKLLMVGAGNCARIFEQLRNFSIDIIGNYGMQEATVKNGKLEIIRNDFVPVNDKANIERTVQGFRERYGFLSYAGAGVEYHPSGCVTFPILGVDAKIEDKLAFDPTRKKRRAIYFEVCEAFPDFNVFVGGSSSFDMAPKPYNKYYALDLWCKKNGLSHSEVVFVGDDYGCGGNDESVYHSDFRFVSIDDYTRLDEVLAPWLDDTVTDISSFLSGSFACECGKSHTCDIERVLIRNGALNELPAMTQSFSNILLVSDKNTHRVCGERVAELLADKIDFELVYECDGFLVPNEDSVELLLDSITEKTDLVIGVGAGVINDLCKYASHAKNLPYYIVATAPSMDGYASSGAAMIFDGMKITTTANVPKAIIADTSVLVNAPLEMLRAGYGDIIGKYSCLNDWRLAEEVLGEEVCKYIYSLTYKTVVSVSDLGEKIVARDEKSISSLMRALVVVGIAMAYMGNSRPASGSEHHLSHYFEVVGLLRDEPYFCHGIDVAYSTYETAKLRGELIALSEPPKRSFDISDFEENIKRVYTGRDTKTAEGIIALQKKLGWIFEDRTPVYREKWNKIRQILSDSPTPDEISAFLSSVGLSIAEFYETYSKEKIADAVRYAKYLKDRYTVLWI